MSNLARLSDEQLLKELEEQRNKDKAKRKRQFKNLLQFVFHLIGTIFHIR